MAVAATGCERSELGPGVTKAGIRRIHAGMSEAEVIQLIGEPFDRTHGGGRICRVDGGGCRDVDPGRETLVYFRPYSPSGGTRLPGPMLWVHLEKDRVVEVYAKRHNLFDSDGVYVSPASWLDGGESPDFETTFPH